MDVGRIVPVCLDNDLAREPYDRRIILIDVVRVDVERLLLMSVVDQLAQCIRNGPAVGISNRGVEELFDVPPQAQGIAYRQAGKGALDVMPSIEIMGIVDQDIQDVALLFQREPVMSAKVVVTESAEELGIGQGPFVVRNIGAIKERAQCLAEHSFRDSVFFD